MSVAPSVRKRGIFFCNYCLNELNLFDAPRTGSVGRVQKRYLTDCHHVLCQNCRMRLQDQCAACKKRCRFMEVNETMRTDYRFYFEPSVQIRDNLIGVVKFQRSQSELIIARMAAQTKHIYGKGHHLVAALKDLNAKCQQFKSMVAKIKIMFQKVREEKQRYV